ncbi:COBW domain-containing protein 1, partial [Tanacetum coccineum]
MITRFVYIGDHNLACKLGNPNPIGIVHRSYREVEFDGSLVAAKAPGVEDIVMLNNGCLCFTFRGDLERMIAELVNKKKGKFNIIIETTVDMKHASIHLDEVKPEGVVNEAVEQIAYANRIRVNK